MLRMIVSCLALLSLAAVSTAQPATEAAEEDNSRAVYEAELNAGIEKVWTTFTTQEGLSQWMAPLVEIELAVGGTIRTNYNAEGELGDETTIVNTILAYDPMRMIALQATTFPKGFPFVEVAKDTWSVFYFEPVSENRTKLTLVGLGYTENEQSQQMRQYFSVANASLVEKLNAIFAAQ